MNETKKLLQVRINSELAKAFKIKCINEGLTAQKAIETLIKAWIDGKTTKYA